MENNVIKPNKVSFKEKLKRNLNPYTITIFILLTVYCIYQFLLLGWGFMKSLHDPEDYLLRGTVSNWPDKFSLTNYIKAFSTIHVTLDRHLGGYTIYLGEMLFNSLFYAIGCSVVGTMTSCFMAYVVNKHNFKFNKVINFIFWFSYMVPIMGSMGSTIQIVETLNLRNTWIGLFIMKMTFTGGNSFLLFGAAFRGLDDGYKEAATIDGAGNFQVMFQIMLPLVKALTFTFIMIGFIGWWNDYYTPMIYLQKNPTAALGLYKFNSNQSQGTNFLTYKLAGFMILMIPTFIIFMIFKNKFMYNVSEGGMKG
ncbi:MAG: carbohydrate ABC transporter permease [Clostridia bacterium]|nr:carbohydrate ABC transporter permease [Clostridia bacterium]